MGLTTLAGSLLSLAEEQISKLMPPAKAQPETTTQPQTAPTLRYIHQCSYKT
ncbi:MAG: hypothetical protein QXW80_02675 [Candidatus Micrarchaeia archaeon]